MKTKILMIVVIIASFFFTSCQKEEDSYKRMFVNDAPEPLKENRFEAYADIQNLREAEYIGSYQLRSSVQTYQDGNGVVWTYSYRNIDIYKIKARKYWNYYKGYQYISDYTEEYQITADVLNQIRQKLKNQDFVICHKKTVSGEDDYFGLGLLIWAVD